MTHKYKKTDITNDVTKTDDYISEENKIADLPMEEQEFAVSGEQSAPRKSSRRPIGERRAVKTVRTMGTTESKCRNGMDMIGSCNCEKMINIECVCSVKPHVPWGRYRGLWGGETCSASMSGCNSGRSTTGMGSSSGPSASPYRHSGSNTPG